VSQLSSDIDADPRPATAAASLAALMASCSLRVRQA
jgi:hypothetical protein